MEYTIEKTTSHEGHSYLLKQGCIETSLFEVKCMHVFVKYCLCVWENDFTDISWRILAFNISRNNKIGICPNYLRMSVNITQPEGFDLIPNMSHIREYGFKFTNMNNIFKIRGGSREGGAIIIIIISNFDILRQH